MRGRAAGPVGLIALVVIGALTWVGLNVGGGDQDEAASPTTSAAPPPLSSPSSARTQLDTLVVKGRSPKTGYERSEFGQAWTDDVNVPDGHNGCDTRNDILRRDLSAITVKPGSRGCVVLSGVLVDPYSGKTIDFLRGEKTSPAVQIDHVVAMSDAWQKGAAQWDEAKRTDFANDPTNLQATDGPTNQQKGNGDTATWLPPNKTYRCTYVSRQIDVKARYGLWVTAAEKDAMAKVLTTC
ncbi:HNH endonuclease [Williamsia sp. 1135]|nr:HNH endonuclease [Williamsia sp. 1135]